MRFVTTASPIIGSPRRLGAAVLSLALSVTPAMAATASSPAPAVPTPTSAALPSPGTDASPTGLGWVPVALEIPDEHWLTDLTAWAGGFSALESDDEDTLSALWTSPDGAAWSRAPLPRGVEYGRLVALGDHLYLQEFRGQGDPQELRIRTWRTTDGREWQRQGLFEWHLPRSVGHEWMIVSRFVVASPARLVMFGELRPCCGLGGGVPVRSRYASLIAAASFEHVPLGGLVVWTSPDGDRWARRSTRGLRDPDAGDNAWVTDVAGMPGGVLATRAETDEGLVASPDGGAWTSMGPLPPGYRDGPSLGLVAADGRLVVSFDAEGPSGVDILEVWRRDADGGWTRSLRQSSTRVNDLVATGRLVVASGQSSDGGMDVGPRILVSTDGGATWDPELSWSGTRGGCARDLATDGTRIVMLGCEEGPPTLWYADVPATGTPG